MKLVFINLLNNFSGSPNVLSVVVRGLIKKGYPTEILTNRSIGFLSDIDEVERYRHIHYNWLASHKILSLFSFLGVQIELFFFTLFAPTKDRIYYINTITPIGAIIGCVLSRKKFFIHVHEDMQLSKSLFSIYRWVYKHFNRRSIFVSRYVRSQASNIRHSIVAYNGLDEHFVATAREHPTPIEDRITILMLGSLRSSKGIFEFIALARAMPAYLFEAVVSETQQTVDQFLALHATPHNLTIFPAQDNVHPFYQRARVVVNLSRPKEWIETFGLTLLEAMNYGIPVIAPAVGGPVELVDDQINGYTIDSSQHILLVEKVEILMTNHSLYKTMSKSAIEKARQFSMQTMVDAIDQYLQQ